MNKKRFYKQIISLMIMIGILGSVFGSNVYIMGNDEELPHGEDDNLLWVYNSGTLTISGTGKMTSYFEEDHTPWFDYKNDVTKIIIENGVTGIGNNAFCDFINLESVEFQGDIKEIGLRAFINCTKLEAIDIRGVEKIGDEAFKDCTNLTDIKFNETLIDVSKGTFANTPYYYDQDNWVNNVFYMGNYLMGVDGTVSGEYTIRPGTLLIAGYAFIECRDLTDINIPDSVHSIGDLAFYMCTSLKSLTLPDSVQRIGNHVYYGCTSLSEVILSKSLQSISTFAFGNCFTLVSVTIPSSVISIETGAFENCTSLKSVKILEGLETIYREAFSNCTSLVSISLPKSLTYVHMYAFENCNSLDRVEYNGSIEKYMQITILKYNDPLVNCPNIVSPDITLIGYQRSVNIRELTRSSGDTYDVFDIRIITSINNLSDYSKIGYEFTVYLGESIVTKTVPVSNVCTNVTAVDSNGSLTEIISCSEDVYYMPLILENIPMNEGLTILVRAYAFDENFETYYSHIGTITFLEDDNNDLNKKLYVVRTDYEGERYNFWFDFGIS